MRDLLITHWLMSGKWEERGERTGSKIWDFVEVLKSPVLFFLIKHVLDQSAPDVQSISSLSGAVLVLALRLSF